MILVLDASVIVKWFVRDVQPEPGAEEALHLLGMIQRGEIQILQPIHWMAEVIAVLARITPDAIEQSITLLDMLEFDVVADTEIYQRAAQLSIQFQHHLFDTLYHALR
ncbi:MAG: type II toxin-antitoxin system VapC family toxin [Pseudomonadota bacterium]